MDEQKLIHDPSQKVLAMYQAVIEFINEGCDINTLKVADITGRAKHWKRNSIRIFFFKGRDNLFCNFILCESVL